MEGEKTYLISSFSRQHCSSHSLLTLLRSAVLISQYRYIDSLPALGQCGRLLTFIPGPGFDVIGLALSMHLELRVTISKTIPLASSATSQQSQSPPSQHPLTPRSPSSSTPHSDCSPLNCIITYTGVSASIDHDPASNLITRTSLYVLRCHGLHAFPHPTHVHIHNPIPLGRGLGSSGAAVVAGVLLGNLSGSLSLPKSRLLDYCLMIERHPDNVAAALYGGFVGTYLNELDPDEMMRKEIPLSEVLHAPAGGVDTGLKPPEPPVGIGHFRRFAWAREIKAVAVIPDFEVPTARAREVLPGTYTRQDMVCTQNVFSPSPSLPSSLSLSRRYSHCKTNSHPTAPIHDRRGKPSVR
jgi:homoserine kinase